MSRARLYEFLCVIALAVFIVFITADEKTVTKTAQDISVDVIEAMNTQALEAFDNNRLRNQFGLSGDDFESWFYLGSEDIMDAREILIIKLGKNASADEVISAVEKRLSDKKGIFESYAPDVNALLEKAVIKVKNGVFFYAVGEDAEKGTEAFLKSIK